MSRSYVISEDAAEWLVHGERGLSSETIFDWLLLGKKDEVWGPSYPHDPADFHRCELLLNQVPELRPRLAECAVLSPEWSRLVERWEDIRRLYSNELPTGRAPLTYALIRECVDGAA